MTLRSWAKLLPIVGLALAPSLAGAETIRVGTSAGPHAQLMEAAAKEAAKDGLEIKVVEFTDYVIPNAALAQGEIEANSFQHQPYLDGQVKDRGFKIQSVAKTLVFPMGIYSQKYKSLDALPNGATLGIPNDPTNGGRALLLLQANGVVKLRDGSGLRAGPADIVENKKNLKIRELDAAILPRALGDLDAAAVNTNYAIEAKLDPTKDAIARETAESPYMNIIAVRSTDVDKPWVAKLVKAYHSDAVKKFAEEKFKGAAVPGW